MVGSLADHALPAGLETCRKVETQGEVRVRFSWNWIRDYAPTTVPPEDLAQRLTLAGLPVDRLERRAPLPETVVVGRVVETRKHPNADKLSLCRVDVGGGETVEVVCGAPNVREGMYSPLARVGTRLPNGMVLRKSKIRGAVSFGMLCSEVELGLGEDAAGIMELEPAEPGLPLSRVLGGEDVSLEIDVPSNRGDCLSHVGLAREVAALAGTGLQLPEVETTAEGTPAAETVTVEVEDLSDCPRYIALVIRGVRVGPSPPWLVQHLEAVGQRSINNVVDVTNFVLQETGQPLHAFDLDRVGTGRIRVRRARAGERIVTLDDVERNLDPEVLLITDGERPIAVAGVMGAANTEVTEETTNILLESAFFLPERILRGSRNLHLDTDASLRFRRGVDPVNVEWAARRAAALLAEVAGGTVAPGRAEALDPALVKPRGVTFRPAKVGETLGEAVPEDEVEERLAAYGFRVTRNDSRRPWEVQVPSWRRDVFEECDLVEEVARHRGYDSIGVRNYNASGVAAPIQPEEERRRSVREVLRGFGFHEILTITLTERAAAMRAGLSADEVNRRFFPVLDPPSSEEEGLRVSLLPGLLSTVGYNLRHGQVELRLFEVGKVFLREEGRERPREEEWIGLAATGGTFPPSLERMQRSLNFLEFKGFVEALAAAFEIDGPKWRPYDGMGLVPPGSLELVTEAGSLGFAWEAPPEILDAWDGNRPVYLAQLRLDAFPLDEGTPRQFRPLSRFPAVRRDLALVVPRRFLEEEVRGWIREAAGKTLAGVELFDYYRGKHIPEGNVGVGYRLTFRSPDRTLEEAEVDRVVDRVVKALQRRGIQRREA